LAEIVSLDTFREERIAASRQRRNISELCVRDGRVRVQLTADFTPDQAEHYGRFLVYLAESARRGEEADG
jgi:hypothetical protein